MYLRQLVFKLLMTSECDSDKGVKTKKKKNQLQSY